MLRKICCGKEYEINQAYCSVCGNKLAAKVFCDECGVEITGEDKYCMSCGAPVKSEDKFQAEGMNRIDSNPSSKPIARNRKNTLVGILACSIVIIIFILIVNFTLFKKPIAGKWNADLGNGIYSAEAYIEFKGNGTFNIYTLGLIEKGKYKIIRSGNEGRIRMIPDDLEGSSYETDYKIEKDILSINGNRYKKSK